MAKQTYLVKSLVNHDQKDYPAGKTISLDDEHAEPLLLVEVIEPAKAEDKKPPAK